MSCLVVKMTRVRSARQTGQGEGDEVRRGHRGCPERSFIATSALLSSTGPHYQPTSGRHCESTENNDVEMQFTPALRQSKLESESLSPSSQMCRITDLRILRRGT